MNEMQCCQIIFPKFCITYFQKSVQILYIKNPYNSVHLRVVSLISFLSLFAFPLGYYIGALFMLNATHNNNDVTYALVDFFVRNSITNKFY